MKAATVAIRLDPKIQREPDRLSRQLGRSRSDIVREAVRRQIALLRFERSRRALLPLAEARGILTDEDVLRIVSHEDLPRHERLVSAYTARGICADLVRHVLAEHELLTGEVNLVELRRVLRERLRASAAQVANVEAELREQTIVPKPARPASLELRDPYDAWVLESAVAGRADMLVTGDDDLLAVAEDAPLPIVSPRGCWERLRG